MEVKGVIKDIIKQSVTSKAGKEYPKSVVILEVESEKENESDAIAFTLFGDLSNMAETLTIGETYNVKFSVVSKESNGRWFTSAVPSEFKPVNSTKKKKSKKEQPLPEVNDTNTDQLPF